MIARAVGLALVLASTSATAGKLHVHAERCAGIEGATLETAVHRELALAPERSGTADDLAVEITCADDGVHARVRLEPGAITRDLDLSEEPLALRIKFVALAIAELVETQEISLPPRAIADGEVPPTLIASRETTRDMTVRAGVRVMGWDHVMTAFSAELDLGPVRLGLSAALGRERLGMPYLVEATLSRALVCSATQTRVCLVARGAIGVYGISIHKNDGDVMDQSLTGGYWDASLGIEARRRIAGWNWIAALDVGAGDGAIVEQDYLERYDGPFAAATLGTSW